VKWMWCCSQVAVRCSHNMEGEEKYERSFGLAPPNVDEMGNDLEAKIEIEVWPPEVKQILPIKSGQ
jgi:hypothetical protein